MNYPVALIIGTGLTVRLKTSPAEIKQVIVFAFKEDIVIIPQ